MKLRLLALVVIAVVFWIAALGHPRPVYIVVASVATAGVVLDRLMALKRRRAAADRSRDEADDNEDESEHDV